MPGYAVDSERWILVRHYEQLKRERDELREKLERCRFEVNKSRNRLYRGEGLQQNFELGEWRDLIMQVFSDSVGNELGIEDIRNALHSRGVDLYYPGMVSKLYSTLYAAVRRGLLEIPLGNDSSGRRRYKLPRILNYPEDNQVGDSGEMINEHNHV